MIEDIVTDAVCTDELVTYVKKKVLALLAGEAPSEDLVLELSNACVQETFEECGVYVMVSNMLDEIRDSKSAVESTEVREEGAETVDDCEADVLEGSLPDESLPKPEFSPTEPVRVSEVPGRRHKDYDRDHKKIASSPPEIIKRAGNNKSLLSAGKAKTSGSPLRSPKSPKREIKNAFTIDTLVGVIEKSPKKSAQKSAGSEKSSEMKEMEFPQLSAAKKTISPDLGQDQERLQGLGSQALFAKALQGSSPGRNVLGSVDTSPQSSVHSSPSRSAEGLNGVASSTVSVSELNPDQIRRLDGSPPVASPLTDNHSRDQTGKRIKNVLPASSPLPMQKSIELKGDTPSKKGSMGIIANIGSADSPTRHIDTESPGSARKMATPESLERKRLQVDRARQGSRHGSPYGSASNSAANSPHGNAINKIYSPLKASPSTGSALEDDDFDDRVLDISRASIPSVDEIEVSRL